MLFDMFRLNARFDAGNLSCADIPEWLISRRLRIEAGAAFDAINNPSVLDETTLLINSEQRWQVWNAINLAIKNSSDLLVSSPRMNLAQETPSSVDKVTGFRQKSDDAFQSRIYLQTSGTTGKPVWHGRRIGEYIATALAVSETLPDLGITGDDKQELYVVSSVPPCHMFGLEFSVFLPWIQDWPVCAETLLMPDEISAEFRRHDGGGLWIATPHHIKAMLQLADELSGCNGVISATMPLSVELASQFERKFGIPVLDVYGTTETGAIGIRRLTASDHFLSLSSNRIEANSDHIRVHSVISGESRLVTDVAEVSSDGSFQLLGRRRDVLKLGGLRLSTHFLRQIFIDSGAVADCEIFVSGFETSTPRLAIVYTGTRPISRAELVAAVKPHAPLTFVPKLIRMVDSIPRTANGKPDITALEGLCADVGGTHEA